MPEPKPINRQAWAALVMTLIDSETGGNKTKFGAKVGVAARTVERWIKQEVEVKPENISAVARALGRNPTELLVRVGYLTPEEASVDPSAPMDPDVLAVLRILADPNVPPEKKAAIKRMLRDIDQLSAPPQVETDTPRSQRRRAAQ